MTPEQARALELAAGLQPTPKNLEDVARQSGEDASRWAFQQWDLRLRARTKFARADQMLFTREALEQATHERVAAYHASRFPKGVAVGDLTTGIGADTIALAARGPVVGYDLDAERLECAAHNLAAHDLVADLRREDSLAAQWPFEYAFADPARRVAGRRTLSIQEFSPDPVGLAARVKDLKLGGIKLSPMLRDDDLRSIGEEIEFVSFEGECREALVWIGEQAHPGTLAAQVESGERIPGDTTPPQPVDQPSDFFFEADPAAIRAHSLGHLCQQHELVPLGDSNGYLTGPTPVASTWLKQYRVLHSGRADVKETRAVLHKLGANTPVIKQRGAGLDLDVFRRQFKPSGSRAVYLAIWPIGKSLRHTILEDLRLEP